MGKATYLADLYQKSVEILTQNRTEWMGLLSSVSKYYKLSFDKNVLIYVQRPDAGLLATKMGWEKQTGRYLKAGCKGIGVVDMDNPKATLTYYFDLADTRGSYDGFRAAMNAVWELERQYQPEIMHRFHIQFRTDTTSIENCLCQLVQMQGKAYMAKYNPKLEVKDENSVLYGLPEKAVQEEFARLVSDSAAYIVFRKCGIQPDVFEETGAFQNISHFNSTEMFMALGYHATAIAKPVLMEINRQIEEIKEERSRRYEQRTISEDGIYDRSRRNAVSESPDIGRREVRQEGDRPVRKPVEGVHEGETSTETVRTDSHGDDKRDDLQGGRGSGTEERSPDPAVIESTAYARDRGHIDQSRTHGTDNQTGGRNHTGRSDLSGPLSQSNKETEREPDTADAVEGSLSVSQDEQNAPALDYTEPSESVTAGQPHKYSDREIRLFYESMLTDTELYPIGLYDAINIIFAENTSLKEKAEEVKAVYEEYGDRRNTANNSWTVLKPEAILFHFGEGGFTQLTWYEAANVIDMLREAEEYVPYEAVTEEVDEIGDFNIPDEVAQMQPSDSQRTRMGQLNLFEAYPAQYDTDETDGTQIITDELDREEIKSGYLPFPVGTHISYDDRNFEILGYLDDNHTVELGDIEQRQGLDSYKIRERIPVDFIRSAEVLKEAQTEEKENDHATEILQNTSQNEAENYHFLPEHHLYDGGPKAKFRNNVEAIRLLKSLQEEKRMATREEQLVLAKFVGWGGLANALTPEKEGWEKEYEEIESLLSEEEMQSASASTLTSYYTDQNVINYIYKALQNFGFQSGNILDPAMGTGNFFSALPESMKQSRLYGVELEPIAGEIARQLYPKADILVKGFEDTQFSDSFFDVVVGNIPFSRIKVSDKRYDRHNFRIHDYFIAKSLDKVRAGGIIAVITSKFTLDKENQSVRKYIAQRAELIGAIRLPENAFRSIAGTDAVTDILFLKKRSQEIIPDEWNTPWLSVEKDENNVPYNSYFIDHPEMVLGTMVQESGMYGSSDFVSCKPFPDKELGELLEDAIGNLHAVYEEPDTDLADDKDTIIKEWLPATPDVKNYSYAKVNDAIYYREDSRMYRQDITGKKAERIKGILEIKTALRELMDFQLYGEPEKDEVEETKGYDEHLAELLGNLNQKYDSYTKKNGYLNSQGNVIAFAKDCDAPLLRSIEDEVKDETGKKIKGEYKKTAVFFKATIKPKEIPQTADNIEDALRITMNVKGRFDLDYMQYLYRKNGGITTKSTIIEELGDKIYQDPDKWEPGNSDTGWVLAEEYLSGHVKDKLASAIIAADNAPDLFQRNVEALKQVQPEPLKPEDISFVLGSTWIPVEYYQDFMYEKFQTSTSNKKRYIHIEFAECTGTYFITEKGFEKGSIAANTTYGTKRMNAYEILENTLNLRSVEVRDKDEYYDPDSGEKKIKYVLNRQETLLAREKQAQIKMEFDSWLFADPERGTALTQLYNDRFNNIRPRTFNGDDLILPDMNESITLRKHQRDVVARGIYDDGNLLVAHEVGAGKTMTACAIAYERKRLGICNKPMIAVPNHTLGQWATEYMRLYPSANILVAGKKDFEKKNRRRFVSRIATGDYDCIIMPHSSFELVGLSRERQLSAMQREIDEVTVQIGATKAMEGKKWSLKQMEIFRHNLQTRFDNLYNAEKKDDTIIFEELGVDNLFVDESHTYKNNFSYTKMQRVAGVGGKNSQRAMDMHMKCQYINEITKEHGVTYLTGTPVTNSMAELYVIQKTLQPTEMERRGLLMFDAWASTFGRVESALEIRPEGSGYQMKTRFAKFHNIPELLGMLFMVADIKTSDMLNLPIPRLKTGKFQVVKTRITPDQQDMMDELVERAEAIRNHEVDSTEDNFLKLTNEARLLSVDPRILDERLPSDPDTKLNTCARIVGEIYKESTPQASTQLIFCDKGTPKKDGSFDFYHALKDEMIAQGVKEEEIFFIHDADTDTKKAELLEKVRNGTIRVLMGSTEKMGTGLNVQDKLLALHNLDAPWRPADLTQRNGRILRQGNENEEVSIFNYITEKTFDAYLWQILEQKQKYISQIMTGRSAARSCEDVDEVVLQYAEFKALAVSDPKIKRKMEIDNEIYRLQTVKSAWKTEHTSLQEKIVSHYPNAIKRYMNRIEKAKMDVELFKREKPASFSMILNHRTFEERVAAGEYLKMMLPKLGGNAGDILQLGSYAGFQLFAERDTAFKKVWLCIQGEGKYSVEAGDSAIGNITRLENLADRIESEMKIDENDLEETRQQFEAAKIQVERPFSEEERLAELLQEQVQLNLELEFAEDGGESTENESVRKEGKLYRGLHKQFPEIFNNTYTYMKFKSYGFDDLVLEKIPGGYSMAHYYSQNGDAMRDPEITFDMDDENRLVKPLSFQQDNMGIYYRTCDQPKERVDDLVDFWSQWLKNISEQGFELYEAHGADTQYRNASDIEEGEERE